MTTVDIDLDDTALETIPDDERGCGYLETGNQNKGKTYLRADVGEGGSLPAFVEFDEPIPFREDHFRSYKRIDGEKFLASVAGGNDALTGTVPKGEPERHFHRLVNETPADGPHYGKLAAPEAQDILMNVGGSYYETPADFVTEARFQGVNKAIPMSAGQEPPVVVPGRTKLFVIHPDAIETNRDAEGNTLDEAMAEAEAALDDDADDATIAEARREAEEEWEEQRTPGVIGYTYLTRVVHTLPEPDYDDDGNVKRTPEENLPDYVEEFAARGLLDIVERGERIAFDDEAHPLAGVDVEGFDAEAVYAELAEEFDMASPAPEEGAFDEKREGYEAEIGYHDLRRIASAYGLLKNVEHPTKDALLDAIAGSPDTPPAEDIDL